MKRIVSFFLLFLLLQACKKSSSEAPPPDPIAWYKCDNKNGVNSMSGLLTGTVWGTGQEGPDSFGVEKAALKFSGDDYIRVYDSDLLDFGGSQFTLMAWIKPTASVLNTHIVVKLGSPGTGLPYSFDLSKGSVRGYITATNDDWFEVLGATPIKLNVWQHVALTFTGDKMTVYHNGKADGSIAVDRKMTSSLGNLTIGHKNTDFDTGFKGYLDNVKIYDKALTAGQMSNLYKNYNQ